MQDAEPISTSTLEIRPHAAGLVPRILERAPGWVFGALIFSVFVGLEPVILTRNYGNEAALTGTGDATRQISFVLLFLASAALVAYWRGAAQLFRLPLALGLLVAWSLASLSWSIAPDVAMRRVILNTIIVLTVFYCLSLLEPERVLRQLTTWSIVILLANWVAVLFIPHARHGADEMDQALVGNYRGIHMTKNEAGAFCVVAALLFIEATRRAGSRVVGPALVVLAVLFLHMTASKTSMGFLVVAIAAGWLMDLAYRRPALRGFLAAALIIAVLAVAVFFADAFLALFAFIDDPTAFTGRTMLWQAALDYAADNLALGAGYGSFWAAGRGSPIYWHPSAWVNEAINAHNGYVDLLIQLGAPGLGLAISVLVIRPIYLLLTRPLPGALPRWLLGAILVFFMLHNLLETSFMDRASMFWFLFLIALLLVEINAKARAARPGATRDVSGHGQPPAASPTEA